MARYIDADNFRKTMIKRFGCIPCLTDYSEVSRYDIPLDDALNLAPTADVVPKSEPDRLIDKWIGSGELTPDEKTLRLIEALRDEAKRYERYYFNHEYDKLIGDAKAEVAREILAEIETCMKDFEDDDDGYLLKKCEFEFFYARNKR